MIDTLLVVKVHSAVNCSGCRNKKKFLIHSSSKKSTLVMLINVSTTFNELFIYSRVVLLLISENPGDSGHGGKSDSVQPDQLNA